jgi:hypothetical protein
MFWVAGFDLLYSLQDIAENGAPVLWFSRSPAVLS